MWLEVGIVVFLGNTRVQLRNKTIYSSLLLFVVDAAGIWPTPPSPGWCTWWSSSILAANGSQPPSSSENCLWQIELFQSEGIHFTSPTRGQWLTRSTRWPLGLKIGSTLWYSLSPKAPCGTTLKPLEPYSCLTFLSTLFCLLCFSPEHTLPVNHFFKNPYLRLCFLGTQTKTMPQPLTTADLSYWTTLPRTLYLFGRCTHVTILRMGPSLDPEKFYSHIL